MQEHVTGLTFHWLDGLILVCYLISLLAVGYYHSRKQRDLKEYFLAGKSMSWLPIGLALMAALNSGIDYLMQPSGVLKFGIVLLVGNLSWFMLYPYVFFVTLPLYRRLDVYSAYEYLEKRFDVRVRGLTAGIFILWRLGWMATALYVPCLAITSATGNEAYLVHSIIILGMIVTIYTLMGGVEGVIWTEVAQFCIMFIGLGITLGVIFWNVEGGFSAIMQDALKVGDASFHRGTEQTMGLWDQIKNYFVIPIPIFGMIVATMVSRVTNYTSDQVMVQRFQTCKTIKDARAGFVLTAIGDILWMVILIFVGVALFTYFNQVGGIPEWLKDKEDQVFPYFMGKVFPVGLTGLVIAAIFAASLCSLGGAINSVTSVVVIDFYERIFMGRQRNEIPNNEEEQRRQVRLSRIITLVIGVVAVSISCNVSKLGTILEIANKIINSFTGAILGIFLLGMFTRRANSFSVFLGGILGTLMAIYVIFWSSPELTAYLGITNLFPSGEPISFLWPSTFGFVTTLLVGYLASLVTSHSKEEIEAGNTWNWFTVTRQKLVEE